MGRSDDNSANVPAGAATKPCPFCAEPIQPAAIKCKHCGERLGGVAPVVIEQTAKKWKGRQLGGCLASVIGMVMVFAGAKAAPGLAVAGFIILLGGLFFMVYGRIGAWWHHE